MVGSKRLLFRPAIIKGESWAGYLLRLVEKNGFSNVGELAKYIGYRVEQLIAAKPYAALPKFGIEVDASEISVQQQESEWALYRKMSTFGRSLYGRVCPHCLRDQEIPHVPVYWDNPIQLTCAVHKCLLLDRCDKCNWPINYLRPAVSHCKCGKDYRTTRVFDAAGWLPRIYELFDVAEPSQVVHPTFSPFDEKSANVARSLLKLVMLTPDSPRKQFVPSRRATARLDLIRTNDLPYIEPWLSQWPYGLREKLLQVERDGFSVDSEFLQLQPFPRVHAEILEHTQRRRRMKQPVCITKASKEMMDEGYVGLKTFLVHTGASYYQFNYWLETGFLQGVFVRKGGGSTQRFFIPVQEFQSALFCMRQTASLKDASIEFGVDRLALRAMGYAGVFRAIKLNRAKYAFRVNVLELSALINKLVRVARPAVPFNLSCVPVSEAVMECAALGNSTVRMFFENLNSGKTPLYRSSPKSVYFDELQVGEVEFNAWLNLTSRQLSHV